jgi:uncharacterized membrane protein YbhN (UPF0104 family)
MLMARPWLVRAVSLAAIAASCWLLFVALRSSWRDLVGMLSEKSLVLPFLASCLSYGLALGVLSIGWRELVGTISGTRLTLWQGLYIYATANVAKYLPGNIFHFAARQVLAQRAGQPHGATALATVLELGLMVACSLLLVGVFGGRYLIERLARPGLASLNSDHAWTAIVTIAIVCVGGALAVLHKTGLLKRMLRISVRDLALPSLCISLFLAAQSLIALYLGHAIGESRPQVVPGLQIAVAYLLAWLAGLVVPGAPGGLGVREGVLLLLLGGTTGEAFALTLAVAMRFVSTVGDAIFALVGYPLSRFGPTPFDD